MADCLPCRGIPTFADIATIRGRPIHSNSIQYEFSRACESLYHFIWDEFCDWYVELAKVQLSQGI